MAVNLPVPYKSQWDPDASETRDDCGPACISMALDFYGEKTTIDQIFRRTGAPANSLISIPQMQNAIAESKYKSQFYVNQSIEQLKAWLDKGVPVIALVHYGNFSTRLDKGFSGGHFFLVVGYNDEGFMVNDPDFWTPHRLLGDHHLYTYADFIAGWKNAPLDGGNPANSYLVIFPSDRPKMIEVEVEAFVRMRMKSDNRDDMFKELELPLDPTEAKADKALAVIRGYKSLGIGLQKQLSEALAQVSNYKEKAERIEQTYQASAKTDKDRIDGLEKAQKTWETERESLKSQLEIFAKAKGALSIELEQTKTKLKMEQEKSCQSMNALDALILLWKKLRSVRVK